MKIIQSSCTNKGKNIGFFDSGIGGLTVLKETLKVLPDENYLYYADTKNVPYGTKPKEEVINLVENAVNILAGHSIKVLVIACNTATSIAINDIRKKFDFPIIGMEPAIKPALMNSSDKRVLVTATTLTLKEEKLERLLTEIDKKKIVDKLPLDKLVRFAEDFTFRGESVEDYLRKCFRELDFENYEAIVLGCTHFIFFKDIIENVIGKKEIKIIDGNEGTVRRLFSILKENNLFSNSKGGSVAFLNSGYPENDIDRIRMLNSILSITDDKIEEY